MSSRANGSGNALVLTLLLLLGAGLGNAAEITQTVPITADYAYWEVIDLFNQFNPSLGTLTGIRIDLSGTFVVEGYVQNYDTVNHNYSGAYASVDFSLFGPNGISLSPTVATEMQPSGVVQPGYDNQVVYQSTPTVSSTFITLSGADLLPYIGTGKIGTLWADTIASGYGSSDAEPASMVGYGGAGIVGASAGITYTYDANTPEPASMLLLGSALLGLGWMVHRRRA